MTHKQLYESGYKVISCRPICDKSAEIILEKVNELQVSEGITHYTTADDLEKYTPFAAMSIGFNCKDGELITFYK